MILLRQLRSLATLGVGAGAIAVSVWLASRADGTRAGRLAELATVGAIAGLSLLVGLLGALMAARAHRLDGRRRRAEQLFRSAQVELAESLQFAGSESDAYTLLRRHLERAVPGSAVVVLRRDDLHRRIEAATFVADGTLLSKRLDGATAHSCVAMRVGRSQHSSGHTSPLLGCALCSGSGCRTLCVPTVVAGEVVGAVLVEHREELAEIDRLRVLDSVAQSTAVLAGLRNLALAEARAAVDGLTGLMRGPFLGESMRRMTAQAGRQLSCLSIVALDIDHLGPLNETLGRTSGDRAIAAIARTASSLLRSSDLAGRADGGELVLILPDTHKDGAIEVAERLRLAVAQLEVEGLDWPLSASFGVATFPDDAVVPADVLLLARAACRAAKAAGRNGVEAAGTWGLDLDGHSDALG